MRLAAPVLGSIVVAALTLLLPSTPTYDPWTWMLWGRELLDLDLDTRTGPAFKPLPVAVGALLAPTGAAAPWAWLVLARAGALLAAVMAWRLGRRLGGGSWVAGAVAAAGVVLTGGWLWHGAVGNAEGLLLALVLLAAERTLDGHRRQGFGLAVAAALVRVEVWPFLALYGVWLWRREPGARPLVAAAGAAVPLLWLGPELLGSGDLLRSSVRARTATSSAPALAERPALASLGRAVALAPAVMWAGSAVAVIGVLRRGLPRAAALPAAAGVAWIGLIAAMSELGYSGEERYAMPGAALVAVSAGAGTVWAAARLPAVAGRSVAVAGLVVLAAVCEAAGGLSADRRKLGYEARLYGVVGDAVQAAGSRASVLRCGKVHTAPYSRPAMAWRLRLPLRSLSTATARHGFVFRARPYEGARAGPDIRPAAAFHRVGEVGPWRILARCARR